MRPPRLPGAPRSARRLGLGAGLALIVATAATAAATVGGARLPDTASEAPAARSVNLAQPGTPQAQDAQPEYDGRYHFARVRYAVGSGRGFGGFGRRGRGREPMWAHDWPRADHNFLAILEETTYTRTGRDAARVVSFDDPELFRHPIVYMVEVQAWNPTDEEAEALGEYLRKGGFLIVDDTRNERGYEFRTFAENMSRALPELSFQPIDLSHEIFDSFFRIDPVAVIPPYGPRNVQYWGLFEENDPTKRMLVLLNLNNDIAEYWEFSDYGYYPIDLANEAYKLGVNYVVYALTH